MAIKQTIEKKLIKFGKSNSPTFVAMSIAAAKGIFRPAFTMADKKENYETRRYAAIREGLTELIAIPVYYLSGVASNHISEKLAVPKNFLKKDIYKKYSSGDSSEEVLEAVERAKLLAQKNLPKMKVTTSFIGVGLSALIFIPLICSMSIKPIMHKIQKKNEKVSDVQKLGLNTLAVKNPSSKTAFNAVYSQNAYGMKVGGL